MFVKENLSDVLKPKSSEEIDESIQEIVKKLTSFNIREDAICYLAEIIWDIQKRQSDVPLPMDIKQEIINYMSENEFNEALVYILKESINND